MIKKIRNFFKKSIPTNKGLFNIFPDEVLEHKGEPYDEDDLKFFFRELNTRILLDEYKLVPNIKNLDRKTIRKCRKLSKKGMVITGSIILKLYSILDRKTDDIDVYWDIEQAKNENIINKKEIINCFEYENNIKDSNQKITRYKVQSKKFGILDIFENDNNEEVLEYKGIKHHNCLNILHVKFNYFRNKDQDDFDKIREKLNI